MKEGITTLGRDVFYECRSLEEADMPNSINTVESSTFTYCGSLETIRLSPNLSKISQSMFLGSGLKTVTIPNGVTSIESQGFEATNLQEITLPVSVTAIKDIAFRSCFNLNRLSIAVAVTEEAGQRKVTPIKITYASRNTPFMNCPENRDLLFLKADGKTPLTGNDLTAAIEAYDQVTDNGEEAGDGKWYGWKLPDPDNSVTPGGEDFPTDDNGSDNTNKTDDDNSDSGNDDNNSNSTDGGSIHITDFTAAPAAEAVQVSIDNSTQAVTVAVAETETETSAAAKDTRSKEPKTGDTTHVEIYATIAMIAGLTWLLLYFMEEGRGMTEREKEVFVAAFIRWAKKGGSFRKCCALAAIFCILIYYHVIGKHIGIAARNRAIALHGKGA